jgi:hypothetical protein
MMAIDRHGAANVKDKNSTVKPQQNLFCELTQRRSCGYFPPQMVCGDSALLQREPSGKIP